MREIIKIEKRDGQDVVDARELHYFLDSKQDFSDWIKARISKYGFIENQDFVVYHKVMENPFGGRPAKEYALTIDTAKEIAMVEGNDKGKQARQYFIEIEKKYRSVPDMSSAEFLVMYAHKLLDQEKALASMQAQNEMVYAKTNILEHRIHELDIRTTTRPQYFTIVGYASYIGKKVSLDQAKKIGQHAARECEKKGWPIDRVPDPRFGLVGSYPVEVLQPLFESLIA